MTTFNDEGQAYISRQQNYSMGSIIPYLSVKNAIEALHLYEVIFNAKIKYRQSVEKEQASYFGLSEEDDLSNTTIHGEFEIMGQQLYISDNFSGDVLEKTNVSLSLTPSSLERMEEIYDRAKKHGCRVTMELEQQFWGDYFTSFVDPFGVSWQMNYSPETD